jgi:hypothetical protein
MALPNQMPIPITLSAEQWNTVLALLNETGPYRVVAPLVQAITIQCMAQDQFDQQGLVQDVQQRPVGETEADPAKPTLQ